MKKRWCIVALLFVSLWLAAQVPDWFLAANRKANFPSDEWYIGYVEGEKGANETLDNALLRLKNAAYTELISSICVTIKHSSKSSLEQNLYQTTTTFEEKIREQYSAEISIESDFKEIPELKVETYYDSKKNLIAAFAYLRKSVACEVYTNQIDEIYSRINSSIIITNYFITHGELLKAGEEFKNAKQNLSLYDEKYQMLLFFGCNEKTIKATIAQRVELLQKIEQMQSYLSSNTATLYMQCSGIAYDIPCSIVLDKIKNNMSTLSCSYSDNPSSADWIINIKTNVTSRSDTKGYFVIVSLTGTLFCVNKQTTYSLYKEERDWAPSQKAAVETILNRTGLLQEITDDIINLLKSK